ncbi:supporter of activation of yellow protein [Scaptodrosophila lebanonensis]|uniref:Supporter of activation of yellow protein n=1 Tax=Drosophila lebanonensis TaxID=7225 RepID=A0A6J2U0M8_DROLE|nr:supporter of activation of yellow protein [Scaptodrosophila lebanonensis]XP_030381028.1 supporter of activation of yellow protein [Scaptodrosophila lebanonensis]
MNDLRQQVAAATSSSVTESNNSLNIITTTLSSKASSAANQREEEQRVSSTSSPAQQQPIHHHRHQPQSHSESHHHRQQQGVEIIEQPLNASSAQLPQSQAGQEQARVYHQLPSTTANSSTGGFGAPASPPARITSTTSSPPQRMRDDETQQLLRQEETLNSAIGAGGAAAAAAPTISAGGEPRAMAATAIDTTTTNSGSVNGSGASSSSSSSNSSQQEDVHTTDSGGGHKIILKLPKQHATTNESQSMSSDERRVEPLRIHLPSSTATTTTSSCSSSSTSSTSSSSSSSTIGGNHHGPVPKITIRPIVKKPNDAASDASSCSSSCAEDEVLSMASDTPHIVPKLTIRAANEERGGVTSVVTSVVPKLIIKMPEVNNSEAINCNSSMAVGTATTASLPKLTIKTNLDGNSESMISSLSPASASSSASCSSSSTNVEPTAAETIPKLTIKPLPPKNATVQEILTSSSGNNTVPKLMIKTTLAGSSCSRSSDEPTQPQEQQEQLEATSNKIPKLTIKTGHEHTVIMTHDTSNAQSIPKLTIKTKSIEIDDEKPKSVTAASVAAIPKLTISVGGGIASSNAPQSPGLAKVVRHTGSAAAGSPDRGLKLTISRQPESNEVHATTTMTTTTMSENVVPKLTIKTMNTSNNLEVHRNSLPDEEHGVIGERIPKLTIKTGPVDQQPHVPKLTIKNLCSPKHKVRAVLEDRAATPKRPVADCQLAVINGGESNSSQEFCGFNDNYADAVPENADEPRRNSDDMDIDDALSKEHDPKMFHNLPLASNGIVTVAEHSIVEMVDLTSPSPGSSPAHHSFGQIAPQIRKCVTETSHRFLEQLQSTIADNSKPASPTSNILLSQLTAPPKNFNITKNVLNNAAASKYPQLTERLLANGGGNSSSNNAHAPSAAGTASATPPQQPTPPIIDSIEILDTPEGSPYTQRDFGAAEQPQHQQQQQLNNHVNHSHDNQMMAAGDSRLTNNNVSMDSGSGTINHLKRQVLEKQPTEADANESPINTLTTKHRRLDNDENDQYKQNCHELGSRSDTDQQLKQQLNTVAAAAAVAHRSRKQKHERILNTELEDALFATAQDMTGLEQEKASGANVFDCKNANSNGALITPTEYINDVTAAVIASTAMNKPPMMKRRGRPKRNPLAIAAVDSKETPDHPIAIEDGSSSAVNSRRVQLLRKRLAIDMVSAEQPPNATSDVLPDVTHVDDASVITPRRDHRQLRTTRRTNTPNALNAATPGAKRSRKRQSKAASGPTTMLEEQTFSSVLPLSQFGSGHNISNSSNSNQPVIDAETNNNMGYALHGQIDLTMCSSSSSTSNGSSLTAATSTLAATVAGTHVSGSGGSAGSTMSASMLPPTTILSSSDPLPDVIFQPNDFSSIMATQQLRSPRTPSMSGGSQHDSQDEDNLSALENSGDESTISVGPGLFGTPVRGRGRGRGSRGGGMRSSSSRGLNPAIPRAPRMSPGASAVAKAIAMSRPRCVGGLKHTPDPERLKGLFSPSPQVFEEDTRMSADLNNSSQSLLGMEPPLTPQIRQPDFLNNEESQSSIVSNISMLDSNHGHSTDAIIASALKRPKKKKMEICVAEDTEFNASTIAEYDWPPPKGCCPSKNRDTFMIQEQVALYLGITSFKRKYPDLPRRAIDMEERNWLQEKGLVSEKMCDLGITAVWALDILDIMHVDFYDKYEEYREYLRRKHLREIEAKQKALGLTVGAGRGLQARDRAMLSASKWNVYFNKTRKEERTACLDLQTFTMNTPLPRTAPTSMLLDISVTSAIRSAAQAENMSEPHTLPQPLDYEAAFRGVAYAYPLKLVPGQFASWYRKFTPQELRTYPLNTALDKPLELQTRLKQQQQQPSNGTASPEEIASADERQSETEQQTQNIVGICSELTPRVSGKHVPTPVRRSRRARHLRPTLIALDSGDDQKSRTISSCPSSCSDGSGSSSSSDSDSDDVSDSSTSSSSSSDSEDEPDARLSNCGVCLRTQHRNAKDRPEFFIQCYTCRRNVHPSCIDMPYRMVGRVRNYNWQCAECKCCIKCKRKQETSKMLYCEQCDRGYHIYCLGIKTVPDGRWSCERCCICMRCGANKPEGLPQTQMSSSPTSNSSEKVKPVKHKKVKWINEYRIDHITKLREHCAMLCVPCARSKPARRGGQASSTAGSNHSSNNNNNNNSTSSGSNSAGAGGAGSGSSAVSPKVPNTAVLMAPPPTNESTTSISISSSCSSSGSGNNNNSSTTTTTTNINSTSAIPAGSLSASNKTLHRMQEQHKTADVAVMQCSINKANTEESAATGAASTTVTPAATPATTATPTATATTIGIAPPPVVA